MVHDKLPLMFLSPVFLHETTNFVRATWNTRTAKMVLHLWPKGSYHSPSHDTVSTWLRVSSGYQVSKRHPRAYCDYSRTCRFDYTRTEPRHSILLFLAPTSTMVLPHVVVAKLIHACEFSQNLWFLVFSSTFLRFCTLKSSHYSFYGMAIGTVNGMVNGQQKKNFGFPRTRSPKNIKPSWTAFSTVSLTTSAFQGTLSWNWLVML